LWPTLFFSIWLAIPLLATAAEASSYSLRWSTTSNQTTVEVLGIDEKQLRQLQETNWQADDWHKLLSVYAGQGDFVADMSVPAMLGSYRIEDGLIRFQPKFPLERGVAYRAVFRPARLPGGVDIRSADVVSKFHLPTAQHNPTTVVAHVYPSADVLPENLLKFYVHFSAPMRRGHIYDYIHLLTKPGSRWICRSSKLTRNFGIRR
jgi:hypothetical protein